MIFYDFLFLIGGIVENSPDSHSKLIISKDIVYDEQAISSRFIPPIFILLILYLHPFNTSLSDNIAYKLLPHHNIPKTPKSH